MAAEKRHLAIYAGSFDPITKGHLDVLGRARRLFDEIVLAIGDNPDKPALFSAEERLEVVTTLVAEMVSQEPDGAPVRVAGGNYGIRLRSPRSNSAAERQTPRRRFAS